MKVEGIRMQKTEKKNQRHRLWTVMMCVAVILLGLSMMIMLVITSLSLSSDSISGFVAGILFILFLPDILYCLIAVRTNKLEYVFIPALFLLAAEYYFFHDFSTWIASDANAAIGLVIIPFYLLMIFGLSYGIARLVYKAR
ncbi:MAG: hypothetical protein SCK57_13845 [Bacillota bacterium]|nr:hypothetical protein [Bacillota bacterium]MDW7678737.1 hypothetical protein [Bacillota bacterium]